MDKSIDFDRVARWYDLYVAADFDHAFWIDQVRRHPGRRMELMCGTGRISLPVLRSGLELTCVDYSAGLLQVLRDKLAREGLRALVVQADARDLPFTDDFDYLFVGFHALAELTRADDLLAALRCVRRALRGDGRFGCSLHNPAVRSLSLDGAWRDLGTFPVPGTDRKLLVRGRYLYDATTGLTEGSQHYREIDPSGTVVDELMLPLRFWLFGLGELEDLGRQAGLAIETVWGDYARSPFDARQSPFMIVQLRPT
jgi:SAM-dependent methyltransferase